MKTRIFAHPKGLSQNVIVKKILSNQLPVSALTLFFFQASVLYMAVPLWELPIIGLSLSAPLLAFVGLQVVLFSPEKWPMQYKRWLLISILFWVGLFISAVGNGLFGLNGITRSGILTLFRYVFWLFVFVITVYLVSRAKLGEKVVNLLRTGVFALALLRWIEYLFYNRLGTGEALGKLFFYQNEYGFIFSCFTPLLLSGLTTAKGARRLPFIAALLIVLGAAAINGSRGSWVSISFGFSIFIILYLWTRPSRVLHLIPVILGIGIFYVGILRAPMEIAAAIDHRFETFRSLEEDKSYLIRGLMFQKALRLFKSSPLIGVGPGQFTQAYAILEIPSPLFYGSEAYFNTKSAHNSYMALLAEAGLGGTVPYTILLLVLLIGGLRSAIRLARANEYWGIGIYAGFLAMSVHMIALSTLTNTSTWMMYGYVAAMIMYEIPVQSEEKSGTSANLTQGDRH